MIVANVAVLPRDSLDGRQGEHPAGSPCHDLKAAKKRQWRLDNKEKMAKSNKKYRAANKEKIAKQLRAYAKSNIGREVNRLKSCRQREKFPEKIKAQHAVGNAIRDGRLIRPSTCSACFEEGFIESHHEDYSKPFEIEWLCKKCHTVKSNRET